MNRFLTRACAKIGRFFWSWGFLKFILWTVTLIILFYAEENWRGARAWAATKAEWEAKGETFDYNKLIPPPVPDDQNLAMIPLFKLEPDPENKGSLAPLTLRRALRDDGLPGNILYINFHLGNWQAGQLFDMKKIQEVIATDYAEAFKNAPPAADSLAQFDALYPFTADLRAAAALRPYCRFPHDYPPQPPWDDLLRIETGQMQIARILNLHAVLALNAHKPDLALEDIKTNLKLTSGLRQEPFLVSGLVAIAMTAINFTAVYDGVALHSWNDAQLADLENELAQIDFLSDYQRALRGEAIGFVIPDLDDFKHHPSRLAAMLETRGDTSGSKPQSQDFTPDFWPDGWIDLAKAHAVNFDLSAANFVDLKARLILTKKNEQFAAEIAQRQHGWSAHTLWGILSYEAINSITSAVKKFAQMQVWVDEARIACALERYRLAHHVYPDSLDALVPAYASELPHDIFNGQPYHYRLHPDGTFLLYSVGWNQIDNGGKIVFQRDNPNLIDHPQDDWVWPAPQSSSMKSP